jgi:hypothetical protein
MAAQDSQPVSDAVKAMALGLEQEFGIRPLGIDEDRDEDAYIVGHYTGARALDQF